MELSGPKIKKILIFYQKKFLFIFQEMELSGPKIERLSYIFLKKFFLYFGKWNFLALRLKNFRRELSELKK